MGKWTAGYHDDVLASKMKGLVAGALKRSRIEKIEPTISYEAFVEDLDSGDSFTTYLIEVLVKEVAERRTRQNSADRRLIADRTAKSLHLLATPMRVYRDRTFSRVSMGRRGVNLTDYLTSPPEEMEMEEDETDYEGMAEADNVSSYLEGARVSSELYDAYGTHSWSHPVGSSLPRRSHPNYSALVARSDSPDDSMPDSVLPPIETRRSSWGLPSSTLLSSSGATLTRQPSIRRSIRARTVDFNDFSTRRRSTYRSTADSEDPRSPDEYPNTLSAWGSSGPTSDEPLGSNAARRFFPFSRRRHDMSPSLMPWSDMGGSTSRTVSPPEPISWRSGSGPPVLISASSFAEHEASLSEESDRLLPRLRRGGLRAPESMLSRHASPATGEADDTTPSIVISIQRETHGDAAPTEVAVSAEEQSRTQVAADL
jgi:hypothetical protein